MCIQPQRFIQIRHGCLIIAAFGRFRVPIKDSGVMIVGPGVARSVLQIRFKRGLDRRLETFRGIVGLAQ